MVARLIFRPATAPTTGQANCQRRWIQPRHEILYGLRNRANLLLVRRVARTAAAVPSRGPWRVPPRATRRVHRTAGDISNVAVGLLPRTIFALSTRARIYDMFLCTYYVFFWYYYFDFDSFCYYKPIDTLKITRNIFSEKKRHL